MPTYPHPIFEDKILRIKDDTTVADRDWAADQVDPNTFVVTVGGVADDGDLTVQITPFDTDAYTTPSAIVFTRDGGETLAQSASGLHDAAEAALDSTDAAYDEDLVPYLESVSYTAAGTAVDFLPKPDAPPFAVTITGTGGTMTLSIAPDDEWPICAVGKNLRGEFTVAPTELAVSFTPLNSSGVPIPDDNACTLTVEHVRVVERRSRLALPNEALRPVGVVASSSVAMNLHDELRVPFDGGRWTVQMSALTNPPTNIDTIEVRYRQVFK